MRIKSILILLVAMPMNCLAQPETCNYVKTIAYLDSQGTESITSVQYYDGLGRPIGTATNGLSGIGRYTYTLQEFDALGRETRSWYPSAGDTRIIAPDKPSFLSLSSATYNSDTTAYIANKYDVLDRKTETNIGGEQWHTAGKKVQYQYDCNTLADNVVDYRITGGSVSGRNVCPAGSLNVVTTTDEDGHCKRVFSNLLGNTVMEDCDGARTYYIYDDYQQLRCVLTPQFRTSNSLSKDSYRYEYDERGRVMSKIMPGCDSVTYCYDKGDRPVISCDGLLREKNLYRFSLYDKFGRLAIQGTCTSFDRSKLNSNLAVRFNSSSSGILGTGYSFTEPSNSQFVVGAAIEIVYYYDNYDYLNQASGQTLFATFVNRSGMEPSSSSILSNDNILNSIGSKTGEITTASSGEMLYGTYYYDDRGRMIEERHSHLDGSIYRTFTDYSFTNKPVQITKVYPYGQNAGDDTNTIITAYTYNQHNDQLKMTEIQYGANGASHAVSSLSYDDLGHMACDSRTGIGDIMTYSYDLHGWLKEIGGNYFKEKLHYADGPDTDYYCYNGNISSQQWKSATDTRWRGYKFQYNGRNMLTNAAYGEGDNLTLNKDRYNENVSSYNSNGAIEHFSRRGKNNLGNYASIDLLTYYYDGSKVTEIRDRYSTQLSYTGAFEYVDRHTATASEHDFEYNTAGMLIKDRDKGINSVTYNNIGLVDSIQFDNGARIAYTYAMNGEKLRVRHYTPTTSAAGPSPSSSSGGVGAGTSLAMTSCEEDLYYGADLVKNSSSGYRNSATAASYRYYFGGGYMALTQHNTTVGAQATMTPEFYYYTKDHLGNIRSVVKEGQNGPAEVQQTHYYPFGGIIADISTGTSVQNKLYNGKELDTSNNLWWYDYGARQYDPTAPRFTTPDPLAEKHFDSNPYTYCFNNPINLIDPIGCDTVNISNESGKWAVATPIKAEGDDIFNVTMDGTTSTYTYTEGEYGSRMNVLNLEGNNKETFGVYHLSGTETVGYVIQPKGPATWENDGTRIQDGTYNTILGKGIQWPNYIGLDNKTLYQGSGVRVHYGTDSSWSSGCLLLSSSYSTNNGKHYFNIGESKETVFSFAKYMGATGRQQNVKTPGIKSNQNRRIDRFTWGENNKIGKAVINIKTM